MSSNGWNLNKDFPAYYGQFHALNPQENPILTMLTAKGVTITPQKVYGLTYHTIANASSANLKPDMASVTLGSTAFTTGSNTCQIWFEGAGESWARKGDQDLGRTLAWQSPTNMSIEPSTMDRGMAEALARIKSQQEYIGREGQFNLPNGGTVAGTTGSWVNFTMTTEGTGTPSLGRYPQITCKGYLNGEYVNQQIFDNSNFNSTGRTVNQLYVGGNTAGRILDSKVGDMMFYRSKLSEAEIKQNYQALVRKYYG